MQYTGLRATRFPYLPGRACLLLLFSVLFLAAAPVCPAPLPAPNTGVVRLTSRGAVRGFVLDAQTRKPVAGARVQIEEDGVFAREGPTVVRTDGTGRFSAHARIGRAWNKVDWMRVFTSFPLLLALSPRSALQEDRTILTTQLNVRVECEGYAPFEGEVRCSRLDAGSFAVHLDDVWLAPSGSGLASFSPDNVRYERVESLTVEPAVAQPGDRVTITVRARIPFERGGRYRVFFDSSEPSLIKTEQRLEPTGPPDPATGISTFRRSLTLPRQPRAFTTELSPWISLDHREIPVGWDQKVLLQVVRSDAERSAARVVAAGFGNLARHDLGAAVGTLRSATRGAPEYAPGYRYLGEACEALGRTDEAASAYERLVALAPEDVQVAWPRYADALLDNGRVDAAAKALDSLEQRTKRQSPPVALARARLFARRGDLRAADEQLARAGRGGRIPRPVQREIALQRAEAALKASPDSPDAELALARALADMERVEEATKHARRTHALRPDEAWPLIELGGIEQRLGRVADARAAFERALQLDANNADAHAALAQALLADGEYTGAREHFLRAAERRPYDFTARHGLALAELRAGERDAALEALRVAAVIGRGKGETDPGAEVPLGPIMSIYLGPKRHRIVGFSRRNAAYDYQLAQALERLETRPDDALARLNAGTALVRLVQPDLALAELDRAATLEPDLAEIGYWRGMALVGLRRTTEGRQALEEALRQNPLHPHAHQALARLCLDAGDTGQAQAHLAAHRRNWPNERERETEE